MPNEDHYRKLANMMNSAPIGKLIKANTQVSHGKAQILLPVTQDLHHVANALHGAMYFLVLDNAAYFAANSLVEDVLLVTMNFNINYFRPVSSGIIKGTGRVVNHTKNHFFTEASIYNSDDQEIAHGSGIFVKSQIKLSPEIGYK